MKGISVYILTTHQGSKSIMEEGEERMQVLDDVEDPVKCCSLAVAHVNSQWLWLPIEPAQYQTSYKFQHKLGRPHP